MKILTFLKSQRAAIAMLSAGAAVGSTTMYFLHPNLSPFPKEESALIREVVKTLRQNGINQSNAYQNSYGFEAAAGLARYEDRWARLLSREDAQRMNKVAWTGSGDAGINWKQVASRYAVASLRENSPAARTGVRAGDVLLGVSGIHAFNASTPISALSQTPPGETVTLRMWRASDRSLKEFTLTLDEDKASTVQLVTHSQSVAVIKVREFNPRLEGQLFHLFATHFAGSRPKALVLDLSGQPGGRTDAARRMAAFFLQPGTVLSRTKCVNGEHGALIAQHTIAISARKKEAKFEPIARWLKNVPVAIRINEETFSTAEIFAGGMQDVGRATIEGVRSGGKGVGQSAFALAEGRQLWLTNCEYVTPSGRAIHEVGISPD